VAQDALGWRLRGLPMRGPQHGRVGKAESFLDYVTPEAIPFVLNYIDKNEEDFNKEKDLFVSKKCAKISYGKTH